MTTKHSGSCLCGAVSFEVSGDLSDVSCCHCTQCRKMTGHFLASTQANSADIRFDSDSGLKWYQSSASAQRGFCSNCGSTLFWRQDGRSDISIAVGVLDGATGLKTSRNIFVADKGDYYNLDTTTPRYSASSHNADPIVQDD